MNNSRTRFIEFVLAVILVGFLVAAGATTRVSAIPQDEYAKLRIFSDVLDKVHNLYVEEVDTSLLVESAIEGMLTDLDPHSSYLNQRTYKEMRVSIKGEFGGLGIEITKEPRGFIRVVSPIEDTPAFEKGIQGGDRIIAIEGDSTQDMSLNDAVDRMRGKKGTDITITILREGEKPFDVTITRAEIRVKSIKYGRLIEPDIGYIRVAAFQESTGEELRKAYEEITENGEIDLSGLVLDLRMNPGGPLSQAISVADAFLDEGVIVSTKGRLEDSKESYSARPEGTFADFPLVVIVNGASASASEIVAGAIKDHNRGVVLGGKTFGKGSVQTIFELPDDTALRLTTALYYTPSGTSIQATGITPDVVVPFEDPTGRMGSPQFLREADMKGHFEMEDGGVLRRRDGRKITAPEPSAHEDEPAPDDEDETDGDAFQPPFRYGNPETPDNQLLTAVAILKKWEAFNSAVAAGKTRQQAAADVTGIATLAQVNETP